MEIPGQRGDESSENKGRRKKEQGKGQFDRGPWKAYERQRGEVVDQRNDQTKNLGRKENKGDGEERGEGGQRQY